MQASHWPLTAIASAINSLVLRSSAPGFWAARLISPKAFMVSGTNRLSSSAYASTSLIISPNCFATFIASQKNQDILDERGQGNIAFNQGLQGCPLWVDSG